MSSLLFISKVCRKNNVSNPVCMTLDVLGLSRDDDIRLTPPPSWTLVSMINIKPRCVSSFDNYMYQTNPRDKRFFKNVTSQHIKNWRVPNSIFRKSTPRGRPCRGLIQQIDRQTNSASVGDHRDLRDSGRSCIAASVHVVRTKNNWN